MYSQSGLILPQDSEGEKLATPSLVGASREQAEVRGEARRAPLGASSKPRHVASKPLRDSVDYRRHTLEQRTKIITCACGQPERVFLSKGGRVPALCDDCRRHGKALTRSVAA